MTRTAILADDLTGANDTAVQFANDGWRTYSLLGETVPEGALDGDLVAVARSLGTRPLAADEARAITRDAMARALADGVDSAYLKIDSTVRGSVAAQVAGALDGMPGAAAVVCPAYPALGRTVENGNVMVDGVPVDRTALANDPVTPVTTADLTEIIAGAVSVTTLPAERAAGAVYVVDARTDDDLAALAREVAADPRLLPVGSAGLARHVSHEWSRSAGAGAAAAGPRPASRVVVMASSLNPVSREQGDRVAALENAVLHEFSGAQLTDTGTIGAWAAALGAERPPISVVRPLDERGTADTVAAAAGVAAGLARAVAALIDGDPAVAVLVLGGDGAHALLTYVDAVALRVEGTLSEGVPFGTVAGGPLDGLTIATKAGGFGQPETITQICLGILDK